MLETITSAHLSPADVVRFARLGEGETVAFRGDADDAELARTMAAMANSRGGVILVGVTQSGEIRGVTDPPSASASLALACRATRPVLSEKVQFYPVAVERHVVLVIEVGEEDEAVYSYAGSFLRRQGRVDVALGDVELAEMRLRRRGRGFDQRVVTELSNRDLDAAEVMQLLSGRMLLGGTLGEDAGADAPVYPSAQATELLLAMGVLREEGGRQAPTVAGLLAVGRNPQAAISEATVQCARFRGVGADEFLDRVEISGNIPQQLRQALVFVRRNTALAARIGGLEREDVPEYPTIAVREAIVNALLHRDYSRTAKTNINIFDNRLEVISPGGLLPTLSINELDGTHEPRNRALGALLLWLRVAESWGTGIRRMREAMRGAGLPEPVLQSSEGWFRVMLYGRGATTSTPTLVSSARFSEMSSGPEAWRGLNERQLDLMHSLTRLGSGSITTREYTSRYSISEPQALRDINQLLRMGLLERRGGSKRTFYVLRAALTAD